MSVCYHADLVIKVIITNSSYKKNYYGFMFYTPLTFYIKGVLITTFSGANPVTNTIKFIIYLHVLPFFLPYRMFVCVEGLQPSQPNGVMSSMVS